MLEDARRQKRSTLALEYRYKLFELRDELRGHIIANGNPKLAKSWVFLFLDSTITKLITLLPELSFWKMIALLFTHRNSNRMQQHRTHLEREYRKADNMKFKQIEVKLMATVGQYIEKRNAPTWAVIHFLVFRVVKACFAPANKLRKESLAVAVEAPETSTLGEYCPA